MFDMILKKETGSFLFPYDLVPLFKEKYALSCISIDYHADYMIILVHGHGVIYAMKTSY